MIHLLLCLLLAFPVYAKKPPKPPPVPPDSVIWRDRGIVQNVTNNYTPVIIMGGDQIRVYSNTNGTTEGNLYLRVGSWSNVSSAAMVYDTPAGNDDYIRTLGIALGVSGIYYAIMYVGPCYGCTGGFSPAFASSQDGYAWTYHGRISPFGINQSSAMNLIVDESRTDAYRFIFWMDIAGVLYLVHSGDGVSWSSDGVGMWPIAGDSPQFCGAAKTPYGYHLICANTYPATAIRHVFSCTGLPPWRVLETASEIFNVIGKGANLVYDLATNTINALVSGRRWTLPAQAYPC